MAKNRMEDVAKLLGLELEEKFMLKDFQHMYKLTEKGLMYWSDISQIWENSNAIGNLLTGDIEIIKLSKPILTEKEKEYLSAVIKPFRDRVINITKESEYCIECIKITLNPLEVMTVGDIVYLPNFIKWSMYEGMEPDKAYTIDELDL